MRYRGELGFLFALLMGSPTAQGQDPAQSSDESKIFLVSAQASQATPDATVEPVPSAGGFPPATRQEDIAQQEGQPSDLRLGPPPVDQVKFLQNLLLPAVGKLKVYGWLESEYTYRSTGSGQTFVAPVMDRFGNEFLLRQLALRIEKPLDPKNWSWGFNMQPYAGSDPAFLNPTEGAIIQKPNPRFGFDFSDLNVTAHMPILTEGGVDFKAGRQTTVIGSQAAQAPWRIFASSDYQWYLAEEGRFTGISATWHLTKQLDIYYGIEFGWGTFFENLSVAPTHISQINYWLTQEKKTLLTGTVLTGPERRDYTGNTTVVELRVTQNWNKHLTQIVQSHLGYSNGNIFGPLQVKEHFYGLWNIVNLHVTPRWDVNLRTEWYDDVNGGGYPGGTGFPNHYFEVTLGLDYHPTPWVQFRPEVRGDFADRTPAFGAVDNPNKSKEQLTAGFNVLLKF